MKWSLFGGGDGGVGLTPPKYCSVLLIFWPEVVFQQGKHSVWIILRNFEFLVHFGTQFIAGKPKILIKTKVSGKNILGVSNNTSPQVPENNKILAKLNSWAQIYKLPPRPHSEIFIWPIIGPSIYDKFHLLGICWSRLYLEETATFFWFRTHWVLFCRVGRRESGDNNSSKQRHIELKFWPQAVLIVVQMPFKGFWKTRIFTKNFSKYLKSWVFLVQLDPQFTSWKWPKSLSKWIKIEALFSFNFHWKL